MAGNTMNDRGWLNGKRKVVAWGTAGAVLLMPLLAMPFTDQVNWGPADFAIAAALMAGVGLPLDLLSRKESSRAYRAGVGVALLTAALLVWGNVALGIIGSEDNPANLMYLGVLAVGIVGTIIGRFRPEGMARALGATAVAQVLVFILALIAGEHTSGVSPATELLGLTALFTALWLLSAWQFRKAAREQDAYP